MSSRRTILMANLVAGIAASLVCYSLLHTESAPQRNSFPTLFAPPVNLAWPASNRAAAAANDAYHGSLSAELAATFQPPVYYPIITINLPSGRPWPGADERVIPSP